MSIIAVWQLISVCRYVQFSRALAVRACTLPVAPDHDPTRSRPPLSAPKNIRKCVAFLKSLILHPILALGWQCLAACFVLG